MPVMFLAVASLPMFFVVVGLLYVADSLESSTRRRKTTPIAMPECTALSISDAFDPVHSVLWAAPIAALKLVDTYGAEGVAVARLHPIFTAAAARFPEIYDGLSFLQWLRSLQTAQLITWREYNVILAPGGCAFLQCHFARRGVVDADIRGLDWPGRRDS